MIAGSTHKPDMLVAPPAEHEHPVRPHEGRKNRPIGVAVLALGGGITILWLGLLLYGAASLFGRVTGLF
jgi:hypothetical protein